jgi:hypothetical protein
VILADKAEKLLTISIGELKELLGALMNLAGGCALETEQCY